ncbi:nonsense-mediated mRNA decay factor SMG7-like isoform X17 [Dreissena polymorpha]|nr:nonsense-mediated mRNA decay factor SMG7-like isoform X2 [Dreissena polymorpha]XP_052246552.1 nonsense-mediated mRNA decay factor SMG7-like isoform X3 [Dreissena polymorpha]XP_052246559.1 nonsense-mediated mRNA decay factor SMG7-like isoform X4 [Dreissena polymorpha]XP_052246567.1 nonsense-mediated mRNA decay factor SMG7-like isoform X5 [Dreissena polymorpha]XP_052246574.1 nonsense-mediated mRNA decay factor SMG7-like isoform X6 [Dreissena polymorpha]XP_052246579.1 nonsense-mediated mRNA de
MKEKSLTKLKVTPPKKSSCLYVCQHCLVHLGDIARYRQQIDQAQTYYWHAASLVPFNGQPYNQLAILEASKGNKLSTVFYYIRSLAVKVPFSVAATNLEKLYSKLTKDIPDFKGRLSASEMITGFLQFHALVHLCTDLVKAAEISDKLASGLPAHVTSQSFPWQVLVHIVAINIFAMHHVQHVSAGDAQSGVPNGDSGELTDDEETCFSLVFTLTVSMLDILLQYTPKQETKVCEYFTLPAVKLILDWLKLNPQSFDRHVLKTSTLWGNLNKVLSSIQVQQGKLEADVTKYEDFPLPEDAELRCFQPIEKAHSCYSYSKLPPEGLATEIETQLRCHRLLEHGRWISQQHSKLNFSVKTVKAEEGVSVSTSTITKTTKTVTLAIPSDHNSENKSTMMLGPSPERKSRQNVAIQAIMQKQAQQDNLKSGKSVKDEPNSPKYLLGAPTTEPVFFRSPGGRVGAQPTPSPQAAQVPAKTVGSGVHTGGVLVLKNNEHLAPSKPASQTEKAWNQPRQASAGSSSWQQGKSPSDKQTWTSSPQGQGPQGQGSPWQQGQSSGPRPQLSPQAGQGQWSFTGQPGYSRQEFRPPRMNPANNQQAQMSSMFQQSPNLRPPFNPIGSQPNGPNVGLEMYDSENSSVGRAQQGGQHQHTSGNMTGQGASPFGPGNMGNLGMHLGINMGNMMSNRPIGQPVNSGSLSDHGGVFPPTRMAEDGMGNGGMPNLFGSGFPPLFRHPPPGSRFPPPPNYNSSPAEFSPAGSQPGNTQSGVQGPRGSNMPFTTNNGFPGNSFPHAPGTERTQAVRESAQQPPPPGPMNYQQNQYMNTLPGFLGLPGNQMKSPLESLFGKPRFPHEDLSSNMAEILGTISKMNMQQPRDNMLPPQRSGLSAYQGHTEGTSKAENYYQPHRGAPVVSVDLDIQVCEGLPLPSSTASTPLSVMSGGGLGQHQQQQQQQQQQGTYSLFSGSPWLTSADSKSLGSSPFSSESSSIRNSPDPNGDNFGGDIKSSQVLDMGLRFGSMEERGSKMPLDLQQQHVQAQAGQFFQSNVQSLWSSQSMNPLERLLELQKQQRHNDPH